MNRNIKSFLAFILACLIPAIFLTALEYHHDVNRAEILKTEYTNLYAQLSAQAHSQATKIPPLTSQTELPSFSLGTYGLRCLLFTALLAIGWVVVNCLFVGIRRALGVRPVVLIAS